MAERMDRAGVPRVRVGYNALKNLGYSAENPPEDFHHELEKVVHDWAEFWAKELNSTGIPRERIYTHFAAPTWEAFNPYSRPGFSVYTSSFFDGIHAEVEEQGNPRWALVEGSNIDAEVLGIPFPWEAYLGKIFNHGGSLATIFAWHEKDRTPYGRAATSPEAVAAYKKFLRGEILSEATGLSRIQEQFKQFQFAMTATMLDALHLSVTGPRVTNREKFGPLMQQFHQRMSEQKLEEAERLAHQISELIKPN
jgi:hypothetical protein